VSHVLHLAVDL